MTTLTVFKSTFPNITFIFPTGKLAVFSHGVYRTDIPYEIEQLTEEINKNHPHIFIDENEKTIESELLDPMVALKEKLRAEIIAEQKAAQLAAVSLSNDRGSSQQGALKPSSTVDVADMAGSGVITGESVDIGAKLAAFQNPSSHSKK